MIGSNRKCWNSVQCWIGFVVSSSTFDSVFFFSIALIIQCVPKDGFWNLNSGISRMCQSWDYSLVYFFFFFFSVGVRSGKHRFQFLAIYSYGAPFHLSLLNWSLFCFLFLFCVCGWFLLGKYLLLQIITYLLTSSQFHWLISNHNPFLANGFEILMLNYSNLNYINLLNDSHFGIGIWRLIQFLTMLCLSFPKNTRGQ